MVPWQQLINVLLLMAVNDGCVDAGYVAVRFDFIEFAGCYEGREHGQVLRPRVMTCEECIFSV